MNASIGVLHWKSTHRTSESNVSCQLRRLALQSGGRVAQQTCRVGSSHVLPNSGAVDKQHERRVGCHAEALRVLRVPVVPSQSGGERECRTSCARLSTSIRATTVPVTPLFSS